MQVASAGRETVFTRTIDAPRAAVFAAWTDPILLAKWWGPDGFTNPHCNVDLRPGGAYRIVMRAPDGAEYPVTGVYREIAAPERLVFTDSADELPADWHRQLNAHRGTDRPFPAIVVEVTFADSAGRTELTIRSRFETAADKDAILKLGADEGWAQSLDRLQALFRAPETAALTATNAPTGEHAWLQQLVGDWTFDGEATMDPAKPPETFNGSERVRALGDLWIIAEGTGEMPGGGSAGMVMTLGYDPAKGRFVGTFIASMMTYLWLYDGALDADAHKLVLDTEGPNMAAPGTLAKFKDSIEVTGEGTRVMTSHMLGADGQWRQVMSSRYRRAR